MSRPSTHSPWRPRGFVSHVERGGTPDRPPLAPPDCPPNERAAAVASLDEIHRTRPLKPPPMTFVEQPRRERLP